MQLAQAEAVGIFDYHKRRVRHVHADLDDRGGNKDIDIPCNEALHNFIFLFGLELAVDAGDFEIGEILLKLGCMLLRGFNIRRKLLVFLDHRAYDEHLPAFGYELAYKAV
ncbi:unknown [Firmicutes bacterium CAG:240]|nr:unknown [Firmicutes bacterium CAG:240]